MLEPLSPRARVIFPPAREDDRLVVSDRLDLARIPPRAVEGDGAAPIVADACDVLGELQGFKPGIHVARLIDKAISLSGRFARPAHADKVWRQATTVRAEIGNDVAPLIRPGRIAVQEHHRLAASGLDITDLGIEHLHPAPRQMIGAVRLRTRADGLSIRAEPERNRRNSAKYRAGKSPARHPPCLRAEINIGMVCHSLSPLPTPTRPCHSSRANNEKDQYPIRSTLVSVTCCITRSVLTRCHAVYCSG